MTKRIDDLHIVDEKSGKVVTDKFNERHDYWEVIMGLKNKDDMHKGVANTLDDDDINTIIATAEWFGAEDRELSQIYFDLKVARYRVFDWLAMGIMSVGDNGRIPEQALKVFTHSFIKSVGIVSSFIQDLRETDYDVIRTWEDISFKEGK